MLTREGGLTLALAGGVAAAASGGVALAVGPSASAGSVAWSPPVPFLLLGAGALLVAGSLLAGGKGWREIARAYAPQLYPSGSLSLHLTLLVSGIVGSVAVYAGIVDDFSNAQPVAAAPGSAAALEGDALLAGATLLLWLLALAIALGLRKAFAMARATDSASGTDVYSGNPAAPTTAAWTPIFEPLGRSSGRPDRRTVLFGVTLVGSLGASASIQMVQFAAAPVPAAAWFASLLLLPFWVAGVAAALALTDRTIRDLEERYGSATRGDPHAGGPLIAGSPTGPPETAPRSPTAGFVH
ncbi:MAG: hypothetical protein L3K09_02095 [Thermoplasmata archaeon]|nr:hypothetical protein [Thermoplasmata archaeon]